MQVATMEAAQAGELTGLLERICQALELSPTQHGDAESRYQAVGEWLAGAETWLLRDVQVYAQGSISLGTTVRPLAHNEYDVDLVAYVPNQTPQLPPALLKRVIGDRLRDNGHYRDLLEEKPRCWRINYAGEFHLDITPSILNPGCLLGGELVPDRQLACWKASNPKGYRDLFTRRADLQPRWQIQKAFEGKRAEVEPFPARMQAKGVLRRVVQLAKRHRDLYFEHLDERLAPISVIITTLAARSYEACVLRRAYASEFDLLMDILDGMPAFIEQRVIAGRVHWNIPNETTTGENFAEKWNAEPARAEAFFEWHRQARDDFWRLLDTEGFDQVSKRLSAAFGEAPVAKAVKAYTDELAEARTTGQLRAAPGTGLSVAPAVGTLVRPNTFFGAA